MADKVEELNKDLLEYKHILGIATRKHVKDLIGVEIRKIETEIHLLNEKLSSQNGTTEASSNPPTISPKIIPTAEPKRYEVNLTNYAFDQSNKFVKLYITLDNIPNVTDDDVTANFTESTISLFIKGGNNKDYKLQINNLLEKIDGHASYRKLNKNMITIYAKKVKEGSTWATLTTIEKRLKDIQSDTMNSIEDDEVDPKDPSSGLRNIMKKMYQSGDPEMKRMINKAWTEGEEKNRSGGGGGGGAGAGFPEF